MKEAKKQLAEWDKELDQLHERNGDLGLEVENLREQLEKERASREEVEAQLSDREGKLAAALEQTQKSAPASIDFPEPADLLNQLKARRRKSKADLADVEAILEMMEKSTISVGN